MPAWSRAKPRGADCARGPMPGCHTFRMLASAMAESSSEHNRAERDVDLLVVGGDVVTMNARREVLAGGAIAISGAYISAVGRTSELRAAHPHAAVLDASG